jgi:hypothetical protein
MHAPLAWTEAEDRQTTAAEMPRATQAWPQPRLDMGMCVYVLLCLAQVVGAAKVSSRISSMVTFVGRGREQGNKGTREGREAPDPGHFNVPTAYRLLPPSHHHPPQSLFLSSHYAAHQNTKALEQPPPSSHSRAALNPPTHDPPNPNFTSSAVVEPAHVPTIFTT